MTAKRKQPVSEFNPDRLMVAPILAKIRRAFEYDTEMPFDESGGVLFNANRPQLVEHDATPQAEWGAFQVAESSGGMTIKYRNLLDADEMAVKDGDKKLASEILEHPMLLLFSPQHAHAVARWMYGQTYGVHQGTRNMAKQMLDAAKLAKQGAPYHFRGNLKLLREAHGELVAYGDALRLCIRSTKVAEVLLTHFPDCTLLMQTGGVDPTTLPGRPAREIPTGKQLAVKVFESVVGWSREQIRVKLHAGDE